jgi:Chaperone of endosialidase
MTRRRAQRAALFILPGLVLSLSAHAPPAWAQYTNKTGDVVGTIGGACTSSANTYGWPDVNGAILKCVSNVWTLVTPSVAAAGSTGYVQFNNANALAADSNLFWDNTNKRLGIGTTTPNETLDIGAGNLRFSTTGTGLVKWPSIGASSIAGLDWFKSGAFASRLRVDAATGDLVFYNTTSGAEVEASRLFVSGGAKFTGTVSTNNITLGLTTSSGTSNITGSYYTGGVVDVIGFNTYEQDGNSQPRRLTITTSSGNPGGATVRIDNSNLIVNGNVGIGTNAPAYLLHVGSAAASGIVAEFQNSAGNCTFGPITSTWSCSSDIRLKKDIQDSGAALPDLQDMRIRDFTLRTSDERRTGVIAQEILKAHPDMVHMGKDGFYTVDEPNPWKLVKAIQELKADNDDLVMRISADDDALKAANDNIADLRARLGALEAE